jgi:two-component system, cell cycle response regulator
MTTQAQRSLDPATIALAYRNVSLTVAKSNRHADTLPPAPAGPRRVLVIDADAAVGQGIARALRAVGLEVLCCAPTDDVLASVFSARPDVIMVRAEQHDLRALKACRAPNDLDASPLRTIIAYGSGNRDEDAVERALEAGADDYVADVGREREVRARVATQLRHLRDREVMCWARAQRSSLRDLANTDALTGIANRRSIGQALDRTLDGGSGVTLLLIDIDHFKRINDTYGHPVGDMVLRRVARAIKSVTPVDGFAGRWGGEEFAMVVPGDGRAAEELGESVRRAIADVALLEVDGCPMVTASVGVATWGGGGAPPSSGRLISAADAALYQSKHEGRDRVSALQLSRADSTTHATLHCLTEGKHHDCRTQADIDSSYRLY